MEQITNGKDMLNPNYLGNEGQNDEDLLNYNINNNLDYNDNDNDFDNNINIESTQEAFIQTLNLQIKQLQDLLDEKNKEFDFLNKENNKLKLLLIQEQKKLIDKDNILHSINTQKKNLDEKVNKYKNESEEMQSQIKELNYKIIELNQNIISKENLLQLNNKIKNVLENDNQNENQNQNNNENNEKNKNALMDEKYELELKRLNNIIDELEIKNNKLLFDNKALTAKINTILNDKNTEINIYKSIYLTQINNLNKLINSLKNRISKLFSEKIGQNNFKSNNTLLKKEIMEKFNELENKLNLYDKENCDLRKENQNIKSELEESKLVGESKEKIIQKLKTDFELMENEYNNNLFTTQKIDDNFKLKDMNKSQYINDLINKQKNLSKENNDLKFGLKQMTKNINEANKLYFKKKSEYDKTLELRDKKLKEYKQKITLLKMKINELHQEINLLKEYKGDFLNSNNNNHYSFFTQNNNDNKKDKKKILSFTPKVRKNNENSCPFEINLDNKTEPNNDNNNDIFGDIKISEIPKNNISIKVKSIKNNTNTNINNNNNDLNDKEKSSNNNNNTNSNNLEKINNNEQDLKYLQEYKDTLKKIDEQLNTFNS